MLSVARPRNSERVNTTILVEYQKMFLCLLCLVISFTFADCSAQDNPQPAEEANTQTPTNSTLGHAKTNFGIDRGFSRLSKEDPFQTRIFIPIYRMLADPEKFNGREVCFSGFWASKVTGCTGVKVFGVFATKEDALDFETLNSIRLTLRGDPEIPNIANGTRVRVRGMYGVGGSAESIHGIVDAINICK